jgi:hypothetical protein
MLTRMSRIVKARISSINDSQQLVPLFRHTFYFTLSESCRAAARVSHDFELRRVSGTVTPMSLRQTTFAGAPCGGEVPDVHDRFVGMVQHILREAQG